MPMNEFKEEKIKNRSAWEKEIKTHPRRIGKLEKVPRHSQKGIKIFEKFVSDFWQFM